MAFFKFTITTSEEEVKKEDLTNQIDGEKTTFTVNETYKTGSLRVYLNGLRQREADTFSESTPTTFTTTFTANTGDTLTIDYTPNTT